MLAARAIWIELGLDTILDRLVRPDRREAVRLSDRALVLVANRLTAPGSEHALAQWLENDFVCDRCGRRFVAAWREEAERKASRAPRVRVEARQLQQWYRTLDRLLTCKAQVEHEGLVLGGSSAINIVGAMRLARDLGRGKFIVTILADGGQRLCILKTLST